MEARFLASASLAFGIVAPALAQEKIGPCTGPEDACQQIASIPRDFDVAFNRHDAAAVARFYTEDAVLAQEGPILSGRDAIEKFFADAIKADFSDTITNIKEYHITGDIAWAIGDWSVMGPGPNQTRQSYRGNWAVVYVRNEGTWKIRLDMSSIIHTPPQ